MAAGTYTAANVALSVVPDLGGFFGELDRKVGQYQPKPITPKVTPEVDGDRAADDLGPKGRTGGRFVAGAAAVGLAIGGVLASAFGTALEQSGMQGRLAAQLGDPALAKQAGTVAGKLYSAGMGSGLEEVNDAVRSVIQSGALMEGATDEQLSAMTSKALTLSKAFGVDVGDSTRAVATLMRNGLAPNAEIAFDVITRGFQLGGDQAGDFLDTINEYSTQWQKFGLDAQTATGLLSQGMQAGARDTDYVADALKEFSIRSVDGSKLTAQGFQAIGLNAGEMAQKIGAGGQTAKDALDLTLDRLRAMPDPVARSQAAVALFGTKAEDLGAALFALDPSTATQGLGDLAGATDRAGQAMVTPQQRIEGLQRTMQQGLVDFIGGQLLPLFDTVTGWGAKLFGSAWDPVKDFLGFLAGTGGTVALVLGVLAAGTWAWTAASAALNATWLANPITWVIIGIVALVAAVIYAWNNFEWFRNAVMVVWDALTTFAGWIATAFVAVWDAVVAAVMWVGDVFSAVWGAIVAAAQWVGGVFAAVWGAVVAAFTWVADVATWLWQTILSPIFNFIGAAALLLAQVIAVLVVGPIVLAWEGLGIVWSWVWENVLKPVIDALAAAAMWLWTNVLAPVFGWIQVGWQLLGDGIRWVFDNIIAPCWNALVAAANWLWLNVLAPIFNAITWAWNALGTGIRWVFDNIIMVAWNALIAAANWLWLNVLAPIFAAVETGWRVLGDGLRWVYDNLIRPVFDAFVAAGDWIKQRFDDVVNGLRTAWDAIREAFAVPIRFVVNTVWNDGIGGLWDKARAILPLAEFPRVNLGFADGGWVPGYAPGVDSVLAMVSPGEGWVRPEVGRARGGKRWIDQVNSIAKREGTRGVERFMLYGGESMQQFADGGVVAGQNFARGQAGKPYVWGGAGPNGFDCSGFMSAITNFLQGVSPVFQRRFATSSFSGGRGVAGFVPGLSSAFTIGVSPNTGGGIGHMAGTLGGMNVESRGGDGVVVGPGARGADSSLFPWKFSLPQVGGAFVSGGGGDGWFVQTLRSIVEPIYDTAASGINSLVSTVFPGNGTLTGDLPKLFTDALLSKVRDAIFGKADQLDASAGSSAGGAAAEFGPVQEQVRAIAARFGWNQGPDWDAIVRIVQAESGWNPNARNPTSSAAGLFQKMQSIHGPVEGSPGGQALWGLNYIKSRYGTPSAALAFRSRNNWYDNGGWLPPGATMALNGTGKPEAILTHEQWDLLSASARISSEGGDTYVINPSTPMDEVQIARETARIQQFNKRLAV